VTFTFTVADTTALVSNVATVSITVPGLPPTPPVCTNESVVVGAGQTISIDLANNCTDVNDNISLSTMTVVNAPAVGTLTPNGSGKFSYQAPAPAPSAPVTFTFTVADTTALVSNLGVVSITVNALSKCTAAKYKAAGKKALAKLKCIAKAVKVGKPVDPTCLQKAEAKFAVKWGEVEQEPDCLTSNDEATVEATVDAFVTEVTTLLQPGP
jgi:hypothetical protein